ncbi:MAG: hypothetical protein LBP28_05260 [Coriobacteriales bacterium]|jgi:Rad3-related DNA helicase/DNA polymerase III epsilon subunit-like protein|nr:hypothetical protein [Coriobacteriales bacterium]
MTDALIIPGTPPDVVRHYQTLAARAKEMVLGTVEEEFVVLDVETTGFTPGRDALIEVAAAIICGPRIIRRFSTFVNPGRPIPEQISELTGISDADVSDAPAPEEAIAALIDFAGERRIIAHNASFDQSFVQASAPLATKAVEKTVPFELLEPASPELAAPASAQTRFDLSPAVGADSPSAAVPANDTALSPAAEADSPSAAPTRSGPPPLLAADPWIDTVELARIALPRLRAHNLEGLSATFAPEQRSTHRAIDDVEALCVIWRVLLVALGDLPAGLPRLISELFLGLPWALRDIVRTVAEQLQPDAPTFSLRDARSQRLEEIPANPKIDAQELGRHRLNHCTPSSGQVALNRGQSESLRSNPMYADDLVLPDSESDALPGAPAELEGAKRLSSVGREAFIGASLVGGIATLKPVERDELEEAYSASGLLGKMYANFEPRAEQTEMASAIAEAYANGTHLAIEAGTGVGKSMAYLLPQALFARRNRVTCGVATKTNALLDQLIYHELPRLAAALAESEAESGHRDGSSVLGGDGEGESGDGDGSRDTEGRFLCGDTEGGDTEGRFFCVPGKTIACDETLSPGTQKNRPSVSPPSVSPQRNRPSVSREPSPSPAVPLRYVALKGYDHYPCLRKLMSLAASGREKSREFSSPAPLVLVAQLLAFSVQSAHDDLDPLPLWWGGLPRFEVCASAEDCLHYRCRYYRCCLLHSARRQAEQADIVVTNHALLFCDVMAERGILPPVRHWVIDEAHGVQAEARRQLSVAVEARSLRSLLDSLLHQGGTLNQIKRHAAELEGGLLLVALVDRALSDSQAIQAVATSFFSYLKELTQSELVERSSYDRVDLWISEQVRDSAAWGALLSAGRALTERLSALLKACGEVRQAAAHYDELIEATSDLSGLTTQISEALDALLLVMDGTDEEYVYYAELDRRENVATDKLVASRLDIGAVLLNEFYPEMTSVVFTSATIATGVGRDLRRDLQAANGYEAPSDRATASSHTTGDYSSSHDSRRAAPAASPFAFFEQGVGLDRLPPQQRGVLQLDSSYDFQQNMTIVLPTDMPAPNERAYSGCLEELLYRLHRAMGGSTLTLFTNRREMEQHYAALKGRLAEVGITLRCQFRGTSTKRLRDDFLADETLSLFALRSFWEGFDAPGDTLRCVVIPKLPFGRPNDPLQKERERREGAQAWRRYVLPEAIISLRQAAGRLIRSSTDSGYLVLADARLRSKSYGKSFLDALPSQNRLAMTVEEIAHLSPEQTRASQARTSPARGISQKEAQ